MGRPIQKKWFGLPSSSGRQIVVNGVKFADGTTATNAYIVKQTGSTAYIVQDTAQAHAAEIVFMVNAATTGALLPGQCFILATPYGGSALPCEKISQFRVSLYEADGSIGNYSWSTIPAVALGQADLITQTTGSILGVNVTSGGYGYSAAPTVAFTGGGSSATATASIANGVVTGVTVNTAGSGYTTTGVTFTAPPANVLATGTASLTGDVVTSIAVNNAGRYYAVAPTVTITGDGTGATATATVVNGLVTAFTVTAGGTGYSTATVTVAAAPAVSTATGVAVIDQ